MENDWLEKDFSDEEEPVEEKEQSITYAPEIQAATRQEEKIHEPVERNSEPQHASTPKLVSQSHMDNQPFMRKAEEFVHAKDAMKKEETINVHNIFKSTVKWNKNNKWVLPLLLIVIAVFFSSFFRLYPVDLPATDAWAENQIHSNYRAQVALAVEQQFPNVPDKNKQALIEQEFAQLLEREKEGIEQQKVLLSQEFRNRFQDDNGDTYLLAIDPYLWYGEARNQLNHGQLGDITIDGKSVYSLRDGRLGKETTKQLHPIVAAYWHRIASVFNPGISLMKSLFLLPVLLIALAVTITFLITRKIAGDVGGFFAAMSVAVSVPLLMRTPAGFSDTDSYTILFPLLIAWVFWEAYQAEGRKRTILTVLSGILVGFYAMAWSGWWFTFVLPIGTVFLVQAYKFILKKIGKNEKLHWKKQFTFVVSFAISAALSTMIVRTPKTFYRVIFRPFEFINLKELKGVSVWPNVLTTVAEFNVIDFGAIINQMGGMLFFIIAVGGLVYTFIKKYDGKRDVFYGIFVTVWLIATAYAFTKGTRFSILMVPAFGIAFGTGISAIVELLGNRIQTIKPKFTLVSKFTIALILALFLFNTPLSTADDVMSNQVPSMNDAWFNSLTKIKNANDNSIITSWWDFGHWFTAISERKVTFDGGDQGERIHWVGKLFLADSEKESFGILRMLNCGQEQAPHVLEKHFGGDTVKAIEVLDEMIISRRDEARDILVNEGLTDAAINEVLEVTHCENLLPQYVIASQDMIGKAGVWGHFGSWDFKRAMVHQVVRRLSKEQGIVYIQNELEVTSEVAEEIYQEIQTTTADKWVSPWPGYQGTQGCVTGEEIVCTVRTDGQDIPFIIDLDAGTATVETVEGKKVSPQSFVYPTADGVEEKRANSNEIPFSLTLVPHIENDYRVVLSHPMQAMSLFTRLFYLKGYGLDCFNLFHEQQQITGGTIQVWEVDWSCGTKP